MVTFVLVDRGLKLSQGSFILWVLILTYKLKTLTYTAFKLTEGYRFCICFVPVLLAFASLCVKDLLGILLDLSRVHLLLRLCELRITCTIIFRKNTY